MATWKEIRDFITEVLDGFYDDDDDSISVNKDFGNGRSQMVIIKRIDPDFSDIEISSCVGDVSKGDIFDLLSDDALNTTKGGIVRRDFEIYVKTVIDFEKADVGLFSSTIRSIARTADRLEEKYVGVDFN